MKILKHYLLLIILSSFISESFAQVDFNNYTTLLSKGTIPQDFTKQTFQKLEEDLKTGRDELNQNQEKVFFEGTNYAIDEILHSGFVIYGDEITTYICEIADKLLVNEPELRSKLRFYTIKSNSANAFSTDQGIVFFTTGLIAQLTSEAQLAYILAHEISHYTEKHVVETFDWTTSNYRQDDRIERLSQYSKEKEFEADKLGVKLFHDAGYSADEIFATFDVLMYSYLPFDEIEFPTTYFSNENIFIPQTLFPTKKYEIKAVEDYDDELSTHPNIKKRKEAVEKEIGGLSDWGTTSNYLGAERFEYVRSIARFESVRSDILNAQYGDALYSIFILEKDYPNSMYLKRMKAHVWMNLMLYKTENKSSRTINKTTDLEGESAALHFFLKKLNKDGLTTIALRQVYQLHIQNPNDEEINAVYTKFVSDLASTDNFKIENFSKKKFEDAAAEYIKAKSDTLKVEIKDTVSSQKKSKYDKIKTKKNADNPANFDSTKYYLYGLTDILADSSFIQLFTAKKAIYLEEKEAFEAYNALSRQEQKVINKQEKATEFNLGLNEIIVVEPMVYSYKRGQVNNVKSEKLEKDFSEAIESSAERVGVKTYPIDSRTLETKGTQGYNERCILISLLNQLAEDDEVTVFPVDYQLLKTIRNDYGTSKVMFSLVEHQYSPNINVASALSSLVIYPILLIYLPVGILSGNNTEMNVLILDLENGEIEDGISYYFKDSPKRLQLGAHMYDIFTKLKTNPAN